MALYARPGREDVTSSARKGVSDKSGENGVCVLEYEAAYNSRSVAVLNIEMAIRVLRANAR